MGPLQHQNGRRDGGLGEQHMVDGDHHLLSCETELSRDLFQRVDGRAVDIGAARFAQTA